MGVAEAGAFGATAELGGQVAGKLLKKGGKALLKKWHGTSMPPELPVSGRFKGTVFRGESRSAEGAGAAHGAGTYYGLGQEDAVKFSRTGTVRGHPIDLKNPVTITSDAELKALKQEAERAMGRDFGAEGNLYEMLRPDQAPDFTRFLKSRGHDGIILDYPEAAGGRQIVDFTNFSENSAASKEKLRQLVEEIRERKSQVAKGSDEWKQLDRTEKSATRSRARAPVPKSKRGEPLDVLEEIHLKDVDRFEQYATKVPKKDWPEWVNPIERPVDQRSFRMPREKVQGYLDKRSDVNIRELARQVNIAGAYEGSGVSALPVAELRKKLAKKFWEVEDLLADKRLLMHKLIDRAGPTLKGEALDLGETFKIVFRKTNGVVRTMYARTNAPPTAAVLPFKEIRELLDSAVSLDVARQEAMRWRRDISRPLSKKMRHSIERMDLDELAEHIFTRQKQSGWGKGLRYDPKKFGLRPVWDVKKRAWRNIGLDFVSEFRRPGQVAVDFTNRSWQPTGLAREAGKALRSFGNLLSKPADWVEGASGKIAEFTGVDKDMRRIARYLPYGIPALTGLPGGGAAGVVLGGKIAGGVVGSLGRRLMRNDGTLLSKVLRGPIPEAVKKDLTRIQRLRRKFGKRAAITSLYLLAKKNVHLAEFLQDLEEEESSQAVR